MTEGDTTGTRVGWLKPRLIPIIMVLLVVAITVVLFLFRDRVAGLGSYGYLGAFLISLVSNATIILPVPGIIALFALATTLNPVLVALVGAAGGTLGEITGFLAGYGGRGIVKRRGRTYALTENWMRRWGGWAIFVFAAAPIPLLDIAGVVAGIIRYPLWRFLLIAWVGKSIKYVVLVLAGAWGWQSLLRFFS